MNDRRQTFLNLVIAFIAVTVSLIVGEIAVRQLTPLDRGSSRLYRIPHRVVGWVLEPGASYLNRVDNTTVRVSYNARGWRDVDRSVQRDTAVFRVLVFGDSFMEAYSVNLKDAFHMRLPHWAGDERTLEAVNLGVGGYGTLQAYLAFREFGSIYDPDVVLLGFYVSNDVRNNSYHLESRIEQDSLKTLSRPFLDPSDLPQWRIIQTDFEGARRRYEAELARRSHLLRRLANESALVGASRAAAQRIVDLLDREVSSDPREDAVPHRDRHMALYGVHYCSEPDAYALAWELTRTILERFKREVEAAGARLVVFSVPALEEVEAHRGVETGPEDELICWDDAPGYARLGALLDTLAVDFVDLLPAFRAAVRDDRIELFRQSDRHWNEVGHDLGARLVMSTMQEKLLLTREGSVPQAASP